MFSYYVVTHISQNGALNVTFKPASQPVHAFKVPNVSQILFSICLWSCIILCAWILIAVICVRARLQRVPLPRRVARQYPSYGLYLYGEGAYAQETRGLKLTGAPVLFLPGNAGSYKQGEMELFFPNISISTYMHAYVIWVAWPCLFAFKVGFDCLETENLFVCSIFILYRLCHSANETFWLNIGNGGSEMWALIATKMLYSLLQLVLWVQWRWGRLRTWTDRSIWMCSLLTSTRSWWPCMGAVCADRLSFYMKASKPFCAFIRSEVKGSFFTFHLFLSLYFLPLSFVNFLSFISFTLSFPSFSVPFSLCWNFRSQITVFYTFVSMHSGSRAPSIFPASILGWPHTKYICL